MEDYWYAWKSGGFAALQPKNREDEGTFRKLPIEIGQWLLSQVSQYPEIPLTVLYERWTKARQELPSLRTIYRFLRSKGYDGASLRRGRLETGPTKAFEAPFVNDLWMTDFSPGPKLNIDGKVLTTHLCLILDDHSRLIAYGAYYLTADSYAFHQTLKQAVQRRGIPYKLYTDHGKPFTNKHTLLLGLNLPEQPAFALILVGDPYLLSTLRLRSHRALYSRIAAHTRVEGLSRVRLKPPASHPNPTVHSRSLIRKSTTSKATKYSTNSESFASTYAATVRLLKPMSLRTSGAYLSAAHETA